jgi:hypothetical protein
MKKKKETSQNVTNSLTIQIDPDGFSLSVFEKPDTLLTTKRVDSELSKLPFTEIVNLIQSEIQINYNQVKIVTESDQYVIIPLDIFRIEEATDFLFFEHKPAKTDSILFNKIPGQNMATVFAISGRIHEALNQLFPDTEIEHHVSRFITDKVKAQSGSCVYCWSRNKRLDIVAVKDGKFNLINSFSYQTPEDFLYFTLNVYEKLSLDSHKCPLHLFNTDQKPEIKPLLEKYITINS